MFFVRVLYHMMCTETKVGFGMDASFVHMWMNASDPIRAVCVGDFVRLFSYRSSAPLELYGHSFGVDPIGCVELMFEHDDCRFIPPVALSTSPIH
jgi:hypothetical protein